MKKYTFVFAASLAVLAACQSPVEESFVQEPAEKDYMVFEAYASPVTRSHFLDADEGTSSEGKLYWDEGEKVGIVSLLWYDIESYDAFIFGDPATSRMDADMAEIAEDYPAGSFVGVPMTKYIATGLASVEIDSEDANLAKLHSDKPVGEWLKKEEELEHIGIYDFMMIYPMVEAPTFLVLYKTLSGLPVVGVPVRVESEQYVSEGFGKYQICADSGFDYDLSDQVYGCPSNEELQHGAKVVFDNVNPVTPLLEFDIKANVVAPVEISYLKIRTDDVPIAGDTYFTAQGFMKFLAYSHWGEEGKSTTNTITLRMPAGTTVSSSYSDEKYHVVLFPSYKNGVEAFHNDGTLIWPTPTKSYNEYLQEYGGETLYFEAYDASDNLVLTAEKAIPEDGFVAGHRYKFSLDMTAGEIPASAFSVSDLGEIPFDGMDWNATVISYKTDPVTGQYVPLGYTVQLFADEACTQEAALSSKEDTEAGTTTYGVTGVMTWTLPTGHDFASGTAVSETLPIHFVGNPNVGQMVMTDATEEIRAVLRGATPVGSSAAPYNLSNSTGADAIENTANCYMVHAPGYYRLPLVIGNAIENGEVNTGAFTWTSGAIPEGARVCEHFHDYLDGEIDGPYVHNSSETVRNSDHVPTSVCILWEDVQHLVEADETSFELAAPQADANGIYWLNFCIPAATIDQGNALIAVKDEDGTIMWSWHIWVTDYTEDQDVAFEGVTSDGESDDIEDFAGIMIRYMMMKRNLGWVTTGRGSDTVYDPAEGYLLFTQDETGETVKIKLYISGKTEVGEMEDGDNPFFQWGRKDPILAATGLPKTGNLADKQVWGLSNTEGVSILEVGNIDDATYGYAIRHADSFVHYGHYVYSAPYSRSNMWDVACASEIVGLPVIKKSVYDPSPVGYCVPNVTVFYPLQFVCYSEASKQMIEAENPGVFDKLHEVFGDRLCAVNEWGVTYYTDKEKTGTVYLPSTNHRVNTGLLVSNYEFDINGHLVQNPMSYWTSSSEASLAGYGAGDAVMQNYPLFTWIFPIDTSCATPIRCVREDFTTHSTPSGIARPGKNGSTASSPLGIMSSLSLGGLSGVSSLPQWAITPAMEMIVSRLRQQ